MNKNIAVIEYESISKPWETRYAVVDKDSGKVLDDAQGHGYQTVQSAYRAYVYKNMNEFEAEDTKAVLSKKP